MKKAGGLSASLASYTTNDEKSEKLRKKAKTFLDERQKVKARASSLWSFLDAASTFDQARFFQENAEQVFLVVFEVATHQIERIKQRSDRPATWSGKDMCNFQRTLYLFRKIFLFLPDLLRTGWQRGKIAYILAQVLDHGNHPRLRMLGFRLLLLWMNDQTEEFSECVDLFANAIQLDLFLFDEGKGKIELSRAGTNAQWDERDKIDNPSTTGSGTHPNVHSLRKPGLDRSSSAISSLFRSGSKNIKRNDDKDGDFVQASSIEHSLGDVGGGESFLASSSRENFEQKPIRGDQRAPLFPATSPPSYSDSIKLINIFIANLTRLAYVAAGSVPPPDEYEFPQGEHIQQDDGIAMGFGIDAANASAKFLYNVFTEKYLLKLLPMQIGLERQHESTYPQCPSTILRTMLSFLIKHCLDKTVSVSTPSTAVLSEPSPATPILKSIVFSSHAKREVLHELLRQSLLLPVTVSRYRDIVRGALHVIGIWSLGIEDERPAFLRKSTSLLTPSDSFSSLSVLNSATEPAKAEESLSSLMDQLSEVEKRKEEILLSTSPTAAIAIDVPDQMSGSNKPQQSQEVDYARANRYMRRYFVMLGMVFEEHSRRQTVAPMHKSESQTLAVEPLTKVSSDHSGTSTQRQSLLTHQGPDWIAVSELLKDVISLYRAMCANTGVILDTESWNVLLTCLLDVHNNLVLHTNSITHIPLESYSADLSDYITETMLHAFARSQSQNVSLWKRLKDQLATSSSSKHTTGPWIRIMHKMARVLSLYVYDVDLDLLFASGKGAFRGHEVRSPLPRTKGVRIRSRHLSIHGENRYSRGNAHDRSSLAPINQALAAMDLQNQQKRVSTTANSALTGEQGSSTPSVADSHSDLIADLQGIAAEKQSPLLDTLPPQGSSFVPSQTRSKDRVSKSYDDVKPAAESKATAGGAAWHRSSVDNGESEKPSEPTMLLEDRPEVKHGIKDLKASILNLKRDKTIQDAATPHLEEPQMPTTIYSARSSKANDDRASVSSGKDKGQNVTGDPGFDAFTMSSKAASGHERLPSSLGIFKSTDILNLMNIEWPALTALYAWKNLLCSLGNINAIQSTESHLATLKCIVQIWDTLALVRASQPWQCENVPALFEVAPWLLQAMMLGQPYEESRCIAIACLCRMICRSDQELSRHYHPIFYKVVLQALKSPSDGLKRAVLLNSSRLFSCGLPGANILIPAMLDTIGDQTTSIAHAQNCPDKVRLNAIHILGSLVSFSNYFADAKIPLLPNDADGKPPTGTPYMPFQEVKKWLKQALLDQIRVDNTLDHSEVRMESRIGVLNCLCVMLLTELINKESFDEHIVKECLGSLLTYLYWSNLPIVCAVTDCINVIAQTYRQFGASQEIITQAIFPALLSALNYHLRLHLLHPRCGRGHMLSRILHCCLNWVMVIDADVFYSTDLCFVMMNTVEKALHSSHNDLDKALPPPPAHDRNSYATPSGNFSFRSAIEYVRLPEFEIGQYFPSSESGESDDQAIQHAAEYLLSHLLRHFNNFPPPHGPAMLSSTVSVPNIQDDKGPFAEQFQYFCLNECTLLTVLEEPDADSRASKARLILRDVTGKYVWDAELFYDAFGPSSDSQQMTESMPALSPSPSNASRLTPHGLDGDIPRTSDTPEPHSSRKRNKPPSWDTIAQANNADNLSELLVYIEEIRKDCIPQHKVSLLTPGPLNTSQQGIIPIISHQLNDYLEEESNNFIKPRTNGAIVSSPSENGPRVLAVNQFIRAKQADVDPPQSHYQQARLILSHLGLLNYDFLKEEAFVMLKKSPALFRDIRALDRKQGRETAKVGILYVGPGQEDESAILSNTFGSSAYGAFVKSLGWEIDLATHSGYMGGLDRNQANGTSAIYYCDSLVEILFHDAVRIPTDSNDHRQMRKKRHIGNDQVHIVWNEHYRDYRPDTITGDFGNAQIIINPLKNGLYRIHLYRESKVHCFGPLVDDMIVSKSLLGPLVRTTALHAYRAVVQANTPQIFRHPFADRAVDLKTIAQRHKVENCTFTAAMPQPPIAYFDPTDRSLMHPDVGEIISPNMATLINAVGPLVVMVICELLFFWDKWDAYHMVKGHGESIGISLFFTSLLWVIIGGSLGLRPTFLTKCQVDSTRLVEGTVYYTNAICTQTLSKFEYQGFPSGHSATAFAGWTYFVLYMNAKLKPWNGGAYTWKLIPLLLPMLFAFWISLTRVLDYHHFPFQIIIGGLIGIASALVASRNNFGNDGNWLWGTGDQTLNHIPAHYMQAFNREIDILASHRLLAHEGNQDNGYPLTSIHAEQGVPSRIEQQPQANYKQYNTDIPRAEHDYAESSSEWRVRPQYSPMPASAQSYPERA